MNTKEHELKNPFTRITQIDANCGFEFALIRVIRVKVFRVPRLNHVR